MVQRIENPGSENQRDIDPYEYRAKMKMEKKMKDKLSHSEALAQIVDIVKRIDLGDGESDNVDIRVRRNASDNSVSVEFNCTSSSEELSNES